MFEGWQNRSDGTLCGCSCSWTTDIQRLCFCVGPLDGQKWGFFWGVKWWCSQPRLLSNGLLRMCVCVCVASLADVNWDHLLWYCGVFELSASCLHRLCFKSCFQKYPVHAWTGPETHPDMSCYQYSFKMELRFSGVFLKLKRPWYPEQKQVLD